LEDLQSTRELIRRVRDGDGTAPAILFHRFFPALRRWAQSRLPVQARDLVDTDDVVQVTLTRAFSHLDSFDPRREGAFLAYLHRILLNCIRDEIRRTAAPAKQKESLDAVPEERSAVLTRALGPTALDGYESALLKLSDEQQEAVILRIEFGMSYEEIARVLGRPSGNSVRMQVGRALVRLAQEMTSS
jgi:RNA polymerase sigma factor (sigma-70 family)